MTFDGPAPNDPALDEEVRREGRLDGVTCPVCGWTGTMEGWTRHLRESGRCPTCGSWNRVRQLGVGVVAAGNDLTGGDIGTVADLVAHPHLAVYNTQSYGAMHDVLSSLPAYVCSEFFTAGLRSGELGDRLRGILHQDLEALSFPSGAFDLVLSTDVFEHVADPDAGFAEVARVLRPGGHHVFTVPFDPGLPDNQVRARRRPDGTVEHLLEPQYHADGIHPDEGALVFTIFGRELVERLDRLGFETEASWLWDPSAGVVGSDAWMFDARRVSSPPAEKDLDTSVILWAADLDSLLTSLHALTLVPPDVPYDVIVVADDRIPESLRLLLSLEGEVALVRRRDGDSFDEMWSRVGETARGRRLLLVGTGASPTYAASGWEGPGCAYVEPGGLDNLGEHESWDEMVGRAAVHG